MGFKGGLGRSVCRLLTTIAFLVPDYVYARQSGQLAPAHRAPSAKTQKAAPAVAPKSANSPRAENPGKGSASGTASSQSPKDAKCAAGKQVADYLIIRGNGIRQLQDGKSETIKILGTVQKFCYLAGNEVLLVGEPKDRRGLVYLGRATVLDPEPSGLVAIKIIEKRLGRAGVFAPICLSFCDGVVKTLSEKVDGKTPIIVDVRPKSEQLLSALPNTVSAPMEYGEKVFDQHFKPLGKIKDQTYIVFTDSRLHSRLNVMDFMSGLKDRGAKKVLWLAEGFNGLMNVTIAPPEIPEVKIARPVDVPNLQKQGAKFYYVGGPDLKSDPKNMIQGSTAVRSRDIQRFPESVEPAILERHFEDSRFDLKTPVDQSKPVVVYGDIWPDWRPYYFLMNLKKKNHKNLVWLVDGFEGYAEALWFKVLP